MDPVNLDWLYGMGELHDADGTLAELDDSILLSLTRCGHQAAFGALFDRYRYPAQRFARHLGLGAEAGDVVSESFAQILDLLRRGKGPDRAFRAYMYTTIRHEAGRRAKARQRVMPTDENSLLDAPVPFGGGGLDTFERDMVRRAYESLPSRWRSVLWALDVEGRNPRDVGKDNDMSPNAMSALAYRARAALRESYLQQHVGTSGDHDSSACVTARQEMAAVVRGTARKRVRDQVQLHLESCTGCASEHAELTDVNRDLGLIGTSTAGAAGLLSGTLGLVPAIQAFVASLIVPAVAVGAVAVAPVVAYHEAPSAPTAAGAHASVSEPVVAVRTGDSVQVERGEVGRANPQPRHDSAVKLAKAQHTPPAAPSVGTVVTSVAPTPARPATQPRPVKRAAEAVRGAVGQVVTDVTAAVPLPAEIEKPVTGLVGAVLPPG